MRLTCGYIPASMFSTRAKKTSTGVPFSCLQATVQASHPIQRVRSISIALRAISAYLSDVHARVLPVLAGRVDSGQIVRFVRRLDGLVRMDAVVLASAQVAIPPAMIHAQHARLDGLRDERPEPVGPIGV